MQMYELFETASSKKSYLPHKAYGGVFLKHLVLANQTQGRISCHLVKVEPFCTLELHLHPEQTEIHKVIYGNGECLIANRLVEYTPGTIEVIPQNTQHKVTAGKDGLYLLASFTPALL